jgi:seryl-tRNA synthetase
MSKKDNTQDQQVTSTKTVTSAPTVDDLRRIVASYVQAQYSNALGNTDTLRSQRLEILEAIDALKAAGKNGKAIATLQSELEALDNQIARLDNLRNSMQDRVDAIMAYAVKMANPNFMPGLREKSGDGTRTTGRRSNYSKLELVNAYVNGVLAEGTSAENVSNLSWYKLANAGSNAVFEAFKAAFNQELSEYLQAPSGEREFDVRNEKNGKVYRVKFVPKAKA